MSWARASAFSLSLSLPTVMWTSTRGFISLPFLTFRPKSMIQKEELSLLQPLVMPKVISFFSSGVMIFTETENGLHLAGLLGAAGLLVVAIGVNFSVSFA